MAIVRSMRGVPVDMEKLSNNNPSQTAITGSSIRRNAKGDFLGKNGVIKMTNEEFVKHQKGKISKTVRNASIADLSPDEFLNPVEALSKLKDKLKNKNDEKKELDNPINIIPKSKRKLITPTEENE